jgi:hypothetical protein
VLSLYQSAIQALLSLYQGATKALFKRYSSDIQAQFKHYQGAYLDDIFGHKPRLCALLLSLYQGAIQALSSLYLGAIKALYRLYLDAIKAYTWMIFLAISHAFVRSCSRPLMTILPSGSVSNTIVAPDSRCSLLRY